MPARQPPNSTPNPARRVRAPRRDDRRRAIGRAIQKPGRSVDRCAAVRSSALGLPLAAFENYSGSGMNSVSPGTGGSGRLPVGRLLDALRRARDEVPPDVARAVHRLAAEAARAPARRAAAPRRGGTEHEQPSRLEARPATSTALDDVHRSLLLLGGDLQPGARVEHRVRVEHLGERRDRRARRRTARRRQADARALFFERGRSSAGVCVNAGRRLLVAARQRDPELDAEESPAGRAHLGRRALRVGDAPPRRHPVDLARPDRPARCPGCRGGGARPRRGRSPSRGRCAGCGRTSRPCPRGNTAGPIWSKKTNGPTMRRRAEGSARRTSKPPRIARPRDHDGLDRVDLLLLVAPRIARRLPAHRSPLLACFAPACLSQHGAGGARVFLGTREPAKAPARPKPARLPLVADPRRAAGDPRERPAPLFGIEAPVRVLCELVSVITRRALHNLSPSGSASFVCGRPDQSPPRPGPARAQIPTVAWTTRGKA